jgi:hypothetical protein
MPVEIKELVIRAVAAEEKSSAYPTENGKMTDKQAIVEECVRQVLKILKRSKER